MIDPARMQIARFIICLRTSLINYSIIKTKHHWKYTVKSTKWAHLVCAYGISKLQKDLNLFKRSDPP